MSSSKRRHLSPGRRILRLLRPLRWALLQPALEALRIGAGLLPHDHILRLGRGLGSLAARVESKSRRVARRQLLQSGVARDEQQAGALGAEVFRQIGMNSLEWLHSLRWGPERLRRQVGMDAAIATVHAAQAEGRGVITVTPHMGNWELIPRAYHAHSGQVAAPVMAAPRNPVLARWLQRSRESGGESRIFFVHESLAIMRHLRRGGILALLVDQDSTRSRGIFVDFFGRPAYTPIGPAHLARRTGAPIIPLAIVRDAADPRRHELLVGDPIRANPALGEDEDIQAMTQAYTAVIESWIRQHPLQWVWFHERWKHRPGQRIRVRSAERQA